MRIWAVAAAAAAAVVVLVVAAATAVAVAAVLVVAAAAVAAVLVAAPVLASAFHLVEFVGSLTLWKHCPRLSVPLLYTPFPVYLR